jgi:hypothetical protein
MYVSFSIQFKLDSSSVIKVISVLIALAHLAHACGLR